MWKRGGPEKGEITGFSCKEKVYFYAEGERSCIFVGEFLWEVDVGIYVLFDVGEEKKERWV